MSSSNNEQIHPSAYVDKRANLGKNVTIEPFACVHGGVTLEDGVTIKAHAYVDGLTRIGEGSTIYPGACIGTKTQDLKFKGETTYVEIGKRCQIREFVTINASCGEETSVKVGDDCLIMAYCHIAHNCEVGSNVIMSNNATLAGHITVEDFAIIGGMTPIHQYVRIGTHAMVGGMSRITHDIPPYMIGGGIPFKYGGINRVGLQRRGFDLDLRNRLSAAFSLLFRSQYKLEDALKAIEEQIIGCPEVDHLVAFCRETKRGLMAEERVRSKPYQAMVETV